MNVFFKYLLDISGNLSYNLKLCLSMKKNSLLNCYIIAIFFCAFLLLQVNCKKSETVPQNTIAPTEKSVVLNFSFSNVEEKKRSSNEVPLSQFNSDQNNINKSAERRGGCGGSFSGRPMFVVPSANSLNSHL